MIPFIALTNWYSNGVQNFIFPNTFVRNANLTCQNLGWRSWNLFYVWGSNFSGTLFCNYWLWYIYIDYVCYAFVPLILIAYSFNKKLAYLFSFIPFAASCIYTMYFCID